MGGGRSDGVWLGRRDRGQSRHRLVDRYDSQGNGGTVAARHRTGCARRNAAAQSGGGSNGSRSRLWKAGLQLLANELGLRIHVCHFPPGASKWNKIEHRMFSHITQNWRGRPLISHEVIISLIANTMTRTGLKIRAELDCHSYPTGIKVSDEELAGLALERDGFHGEWNYVLFPQ